VNARSRRQSALSTMGLAKVDGPAPFFDI
jgi:hypothetical protein